MLDAGRDAIDQGHNQVRYCREGVFEGVPRSSRSLIGVIDVLQYTRTAGHPDLVALLAERYSRHMNRTVDAMNEVAVTVGASQVRVLFNLNTSHTSVVEQRLSLSCTGYVRPC